MNTVNIYNFLNHKRVRLEGKYVVITDEAFEYACRYAIAKCGSHLVSEEMAKEAFVEAYNKGLCYIASSQYES